MEIGQFQKENMTEILLNLCLKEFDQNIIKNNIEKIVNKLDDIDIEEDKHKYLCLSCIYGAFLGDSMGSCCEFSQPSLNNHLYIFQYENGIFRPGEVTDDSEMAISASFAYIDGINEESANIQDLIYYYYCIWRSSGPKDIGGATSNALRFWKNQSIFDTHFNYKYVQAYNWDSLANGFLMRISTFIAFYYYSHLQLIYEIIQKYFNEGNNDLTDEILALYMDIYVESSKNTEITHPNYENGISSAVFTLLVLISMVTKDAKKAYSFFKIIANSKKFVEIHNEKHLKHFADATQKKYLEIIKEIETGKMKPVYSQMGYYIHGFKLSIYYLKKIADMGPEIEYDYYYKLMCKVCDFGGDTDTNCAIVGAMVGPLIGYKNFNSKYFNRFIRFIPEERSQFNSAFMYIYVNCLEEKFLKNKKETSKEEQNKNEPNNGKEEKIVEPAEKKEGEIKNPEDPNKKEESAEKKEGQIKNQEDPNKKEESDDKKEGKIKNPEDPNKKEESAEKKEEKIKNPEDLNKKEDKKPESSNMIIEDEKNKKNDEKKGSDKGNTSQKKEEEGYISKFLGLFGFNNKPEEKKELKNFKYTAYKKILEFLTKEINI